MRLKTYAETNEEKLSEFDIWVTPSLGGVEENEQFNEVLKNLRHGFPC